jgi:hypothetical protein
LLIFSPRSAMSRFILSWGSNWWVGNRKTSSSEWGSKRKKPMCWHLLLCQHLPSCSYSTSPIVRPSTKVSPPRHKDSRLVTARFSSRHDSSRLGSHRLPSYKWELFHMVPLNMGTPSQRTIHMVPLHTVHVLHSFYTCSTSRRSKEQAKNKKNSSHLIVELLFRFMFSLFHDLTINQQSILTSLSLV